MKDQPSRRFGLMDSIILVASMAVGSLSIRPFLLYGRGMLEFFRSDHPSYSLSAYPDAALNFVGPWLASLTGAFLIIRLRRPRPTFHRMMRQPGMAACFGAFAMMVVGCISASVAMVLIGLPQQQEDFYIKFLLPIFPPASAAVAAVWLIMRLARIWRPEPGWIDRFGRVLGTCWVVVFLVSTWSSFWFSAALIKAFPTPLAPAQVIHEEQQIDDLQQEMEQEEQEQIRLKQELQRLQREREQLQREGEQLHDSL